MRTRFYQKYILLIVAGLFIYSCDSSSTSSYSVDNGDNNMGGGSNNTELPTGVSNCIS